MGDAKHMPGPLTADGTQLFDGGGFAVADTAGVHLHRDYRNDEHGHWAHRPDLRRERSEEEERANARRLALCWNTHDELLAACQYVADMLAQRFPGGDGQAETMAEKLAGAGGIYAQRLVADAIAKAEGSSDTADDDPAADAATPLADPDPDVLHAPDLGGESGAGEGE